jgi:hypothetical protein
LPHDLIDHNISFRRFLRKRIMPGNDLGANNKDATLTRKALDEDSAEGADCPGSYFANHARNRGNAKRGGDAVRLP